MFLDNLSYCFAPLVYACVGLSGPYICSSHPQLSFTRHSFLPKAKEVNMPKSIQPYILLQPLGLIDMSKELLKFWACDVRLIPFFFSRVWSDLYGKWLTSLLQRLLCPVFLLCVSVECASSPHLPCCGAWPLPWEKAVAHKWCHGHVLCDCIWHLLSLCTPGSGRQVISHVKGSCVMNPKFSHSLLLF